MTSQLSILSVALNIFLITGTLEDSGDPSQLRLQQPNGDAEKPCAAPLRCSKTSLRLGCAAGFLFPGATFKFATISLYSES